MNPRLPTNEFGGFKENPLADSRLPVGGSGGLLIFSESDVAVQAQEQAGRIPSTDTRL